jgi:hypothetical protein
MQKTLTLIIIGLISMGLFSCFKKKSELNQTSESELQSEIKIENQDLTKPEITKEFDDLSSKAYEYLTARQKIMEEKYAIGKYEKWFYDQETGYLTFSDGDIIKIKIKYEEVGSISKTSNTWLWSWANPHLEDKIKTDILEVKEYGEKHNFEPLTKRKWYADEYDGWEMTGISAYLMKAEGAYRVPTENTFSFMIFKEVIDLRTE